MYMCDVTHIYVSRDSLTTYVPRLHENSGYAVMWLMHVCNMTHVTHMYMCVTWPMHMCDKTRVYVWRDSWIPYVLRYHKISYYSATWLIYMCDVTYVYVWRHSCTCTFVTWLMYMCDVTHEPLTSRAYIKSQVTVWHDTCMGVTWIYTLTTPHLHTHTHTHTHAKTHTRSLSFSLAHTHTHTGCEDCRQPIYVHTHTHTQQHTHTRTYTRTQTHPHTNTHDSQIYVWHDSNIRVTWLNDLCDMIQIYVWHDSSWTNQDMRC